MINIAKLLTKILVFFHFCCYLISLILAPPFPMTHPIRSFGMFISVVVVVTLAKAVAAVPGRRLLVAAKVARAGIHKEPKCKDTSFTMC